MSRKSHCSNETQFQPACEVFTWLVIRDKYSVHVRSRALAHFFFFFYWYDDLLKTKSKNVNVHREKKNTYTTENKGKNCV